MPEDVVVVPGCTDINRGDQALIWESARLLEDAVPGIRVFLLDHGETREERFSQSGQSADRGYRIIRRILPHPRRGIHREDDMVKDRPLSRLLMVARAAVDFIKYATVLFLVHRPTVVDRLLDIFQRESLDRIRRAKAIVVKGGGFLHANGEATAAYYMWYQLFYMRLAKRLGVAGGSQL